MVRSEESAATGPSAFPFYRFGARPPLPGIFQGQPKPGTAPSSREPSPRREVSEGSAPP